MLKTIKSTYPDGSPLIEYTVLNTYLHGIRREWYPSGQLMLEDTFQIGKQDGPSKRWAENGILIYEANYASGTTEGIVTHWYDNGFLKRRFNSHIGQYHGVYEEWYPSGNKLCEYTYNKTKKHGHCKDYYDIPGTVKAIYTVENEILMGPYKEWDEQGNLVKDVIYVPCEDTLERYDELYAGNYNGLYEQGADPHYTNPYKSRPINNTSTTSSP